MHDVMVIGGGIVGLATAYRLTEQYPRLSVIVLEKESRLAAHQSGHNSGVLHSGIYYKPGSLKAAACRAGKQAMQAFCEREGIPYNLCGKVIVAVDESELALLQSLYERGRANQVRCEIIGRERLRELEPHAEGLQAIHVPEAGITDYRAVCERLAERVRERGGEVRCGAQVTGLKTTATEIVAETTAGAFAARYAVNCGGLHADRVARLAGVRPPLRIVPFRGEYYELTGQAEPLCRALIYPLPDSRFPFLGVHFTRMIRGGVECGPNAVLAFAREGYRKRDVRAGDLLEAITYTGFLKLARQHWRMGAHEMWRSLSKSAFVRALARLVPEIRARHLVPAPAGVRAQAIDAAGAIVDDFAVAEQPRLVNVLNAPSPAATAALAIGHLIVEKLAAQF
ncbi:MAG TPA: L-2-hydroxyglutarate oxidase [Blastocatellia bacterium]|nr:L-2-hydroxyglutarate oxidase [Blastocatellia bacterium]